MRGRLIGAVCGAAVVAGAVGGHLLMPYDLAAGAPSQPLARTGQYAPSAQWRHADLATRADVYESMVGLVGHEQTCMADVAHSYQGAVKGSHMLTGWDVPDHLHPGKHYKMGGYVKGVCDHDPDLGFYVRIKR